MKQRCPNCGQWCEAKAQRVFDRVSNSWLNSVEYGAEIGEYITKKVGLKGVGSIIGGALGSTHGVASGICNGLLGGKYQFQCSDCGATWETDDKYADQTAEYRHEQKVIELLSPTNVKTVISEGTDSEQQHLVARCHQILREEKNTGFKALACYALSYHCFKVDNDRGQALNWLNKSEQYYPNDASIRVNRALITPSSDNSEEEYSRFCGLVTYYKDCINSFYTEQEIVTAMKEAYDNYVVGFMSIPQQHREVIMVVDSINVFADGVLDCDVKILLDSKLPQGLKFTDGRYMLNTPYVCHPYKPDRYLRYENHEDVLFQDEMRDLQLFLGQLGAKRITISRSKSEEKRSSDFKEDNKNIGASKGNDSAKADKDNSASEAIRTTLTRTLNIGSEMERGELPEMPTEFLGWSQQTSWQDFAENRFRAKLKSHTLDVSTSEARAIDSNRQLKVEAEISALVAKVNVGYQQKRIHASSSSTEQHFILEVEFYPLSDYNKPDTGNCDNVQPMVVSESDESPLIQESLTETAKVSIFTKILRWFKSK